MSGGPGAVQTSAPFNAAPPDDVITKPVVPDRLYETLLKWLE